MYVFVECRFHTSGYFNEGLHMCGMAVAMCCVYRGPFLLCLVALVIVEKVTGGR